MATGSLTDWFGKPLVDMLTAKFTAVFPEFDETAFRKSAKGLEELTLMKRIGRIADAMTDVLPEDSRAVYSIQEKLLGPPLTEKQQTFNDGYWMLPLADFWTRYHYDDFNTCIKSIEQLTQRGTAEFAVRPLIARYPTECELVLEKWTAHSSFHVRRLASEGTRPYLPWGGKLGVGTDQSKRYLSIISVLKNDAYPYVRRSLGNHVRDWRRIDSTVADDWIAAHNPDPDILKLALPKKTNR